MQLYFAMGTLTANPPKSAKPEMLLALGKLPPFPTVALKALNLVTGANSSLSELCDLVRLDPVFTGEILRIANSPLIAFSKEVTSIMQASMLLGFRRLRRIVMAVGLRSYMKPFSPALQACWRHSVACAMIAEQMARWNSIDRDFAYTSGLMHDIGRIALATVSPQSYSDLIDRAATDPAWDVLQRERESFGIDHCFAGRMLVIAWKLPESFVETTCSHHEPLTHHEDAAEVIRHSCLLADALGFVAAPHCSIRSCEEILAEFPGIVRKHMPGKDQLAAEIAKEISTVETA